MLDKKLPNSSQNDDVPDDEFTLSEVGKGALSEFQQFIEENQKTMDRLMQDHLKELFKDFSSGKGSSRDIYN